MSYSVVYLTISLTNLFIKVVAIISYFLDSAVVVKKESSSFDVEFAKSNQRLYKWFPPIKHFPVSRYFSQNDGIAYLNIYKLKPIFSDFLFFFTAPFS
jgi:hypothetical protein